MKILFYADQHYDMRNLSRTVCAGNAIAKIAEAERPDITVNGGDLGISRGSLQPHVAFEIRKHIEQVARVSGLYYVLKGNHDDSYHDDRGDVLDGILGGELGAAFAENIFLEQYPRVTIQVDPDAIDCCGDAQRAIAMLFVPSPSRAALSVFEKNEGDGVPVHPRDLMAIAVQAKIAEAKHAIETELPAGCETKIVAFFHGTVDGAVLDNEQQMPAGQDYSIPHHAFQGVDLVLCGHIHKPQHWPAGPMHPEGYYVGSPACLTWGERHEPRCLILDTEEMEVTSIPIPSAEQMIQVDYEWQDSSSILSIEGAVSNAVEEIPLGEARVRLIVKAPRSVLSSLNGLWEKSIVEMHDLVELKLIKEAIDDGVVRTDLTTGWTVLDAVERYLELKNVGAEVASGVMEIATSIESKVRDDHLDACYDFRPLHLGLTNWCQYEDVDLNLRDLNGLVAVTGLNTTGKSNLVRAVVFALFKKQLAGKNLSSLVRFGEKKAVDSLTFESNGSVYLITRTIKVNSKGVGTATLEFLRQDGTPTPGVIAWQSVAEGTAGETQQAIEELVGPWDLFSWISYAGQNDVDGLLDLTPSELKDVLLAVQQRNWEARVKLGKAKRDELWRERDDLTGKLQEQPELQTRLDAIEQEAAPIKAEIHRLAKEVLMLPDQSVIEEEILAGERTVARMEAEQASASKTLQVVAGLHQEQDRLQARVEPLVEAVQYTPAADPVELREATQAKLDAMGSQADALAKRNEKVEMAKGARAGAQDALNDWIAKAGRAATAVVELSGEVTAARNELEEARRRTGLIKEVPCKGSEWTEDTLAGRGVVVDMGACQFLQEAIEDRAALPTLQVTVADVERRWNAAKAGQEEASAGKVEHQAQFDAMDQKLNGFISEVNQEAADDLKARTELVEDLNLADRIEQNTKQAAEAQEELAEIRNRIQQIGEELLAIGKLPSVTEAKEQIVKLQAAIITRGNDKAALISDRRKLHDEIQAKRDLMARLEGQHTEVTKRLEKLVLHNERRTVVLQEAAVAVEYVTAMERDGVPFLILEQFAIPGLRARVNEYLSGSDIRIDIETTRSTQAGDVRNDVDIYFTDPKGRHHLSSASGYQRTDISMAFRAALADLEADATGSTIHWAAQDEGLGTMDTLNLESAKATLKEIAKRRGSFWIISHVGGVDEAADRVVQVTSNGDRSTVQVV